MSPRIRYGFIPGLSSSFYSVFVPVLPSLLFFIIEDPCSRNRQITDRNFLATLLQITNDEISQSHSALGTPMLNSIFSPSNLLRPSVILRIPTNFQEEPLQVSLLEALSVSPLSRCWVSSTTSDSASMQIIRKMVEKPNLMPEKNCRPNLKATNMLGKK